MSGYSVTQSVWSMKWLLMLLPMLPLMLVQGAAEEGASLTVAGEAFRAALVDLIALSLGIQRDR